jgi:hypothetical protein
MGCRRSSAQPQASGPLAKIQRCYAERERVDGRQGDLVFLRDRPLAQTSRGRSLSRTFRWRF